MSDQPAYRWLDQQGEAFGAPGLEPRWTSSMKDAVVTAYAGSSRIWFTCSHGILNEIYHPTIDRPQVRDMEFLITDGETFVHEEKRDLVTTFEYIDPEALGVRYVNRDPDGRYSLTKEMICDPHHGVVLTRVRLEGRDDLVPRLKVYALLAPHLDGGGAGNSARALDLAGHKVLLAWKNEWSLVMTASCGFKRMSCGFVGASDGWQDLMQNFEMDWEFGSATNGNVAVMGEIDLGCSERLGQWTLTGRAADRCEGSERQRISAIREFTLAIGIGEGHHTAAQKTMGALSTPFEEQREAVHRAVEAGGASGVACGQGAGRRQADAGQPRRAAGARGQDLLGRVCGVGVDSLGPGQRATTTWAAITWCGRATWCRRRQRCWHVGGRRRHGARWCTWRARSIPNGGFAQNFWIDGTPYWSGMQLDEVAFPLILAWRLWKADGLGELQHFSFCGAGGGIPGASCAHYASGALGRKCGLLAVDAGSGDWRADLRGGDGAGARVGGAGRVS